jgi:hypothetical protein
MWKLRLLLSCKYSFAGLYPFKQNGGAENEAKQKVETVVWESADISSLTGRYFAGNAFSADILFLPYFFLNAGKLKIQAV